MIILPVSGDTVISMIVSRKTYLLIWILLWKMVDRQSYLSQFCRKKRSRKLESMIIQSRKWLSDQYLIMTNSSKSIVGKGWIERSKRKVESTTKTLLATFLINSFDVMYRVVLSSSLPEIIRGVLDSSIKILSTSSTIQ